MSSYQDTLDAFAAAILPSIYTYVMENVDFQDEGWRAGIAVEAYKIADEMMKCRKALYPFSEEDNDVE